MAIEGTRAYTTFVALRLHFTTDFDYIKYNGKARSISDEKLQSRKDYDHFRRIERRYGDHLQDFIVANLVNEHTAWINDLVKPRADVVFNTWKKNIENIVPNVEEDLKGLDQHMFSAGKETHPPLLKKYLAKKIKPETMIALDYAFSYIKNWDRHLDDPIIWPEHSMFLRKYKPFVIMNSEAVEKVATIAENR